MKARLTPIFFREGKTEKFASQIAILADLLTADAEFLKPIGLGDPIPECEAVVFPEILGEAYRNAAAFRAIDKPILIVTSEFATVSTWDWEIMDFLRSKGVATIAPYNLDQTRRVCRILIARRRMAGVKFIIFQDDPGEGFQPDIFKSFYWWEEESDHGLRDKFGLTIERRSYRDLGKKAMGIPDQRAKKEWKQWDLPAASDVAEVMILNAAKLYLAVKEEIGDDESIGGVGINCLNESHFCNTTPCLAWNMFFEREGLLWACEGDTRTLATKYMLYHSLVKPIMMTNFYPFLMGQAALKHEGIPAFPEVVDDPENHVLLAHCGYFGLIPQRMSSEWIMRPKVLGIVHEDSHVIDARFPPGDVTVAKVDAALERIMVIEGHLKGYVQYPGSDCRNGGILRVPDGHRLMNEIVSHHQLVMPGSHARDISLVAKIFGFEMTTLS